MAAPTAGPDPFNEDEDSEKQQRPPIADDFAESEAEASKWDWSAFDAATLASRISTMQDRENLQARLEAMDMAWVLVFDADTEDEAVYSMEVDGEEAEGEEAGSHVVLAFEDKAEAERYAASLREEAYSSDASVQALDVEALVVTSREADFRVGIVFKGDLTTYTSGVAKEESASMGLPDDWSSRMDVASFITTGLDEEEERRKVARSKERVSVSISMVPESCFEGKTASDFLDPTEDPVWVLVHDEGTGDAQYFSMTLNGTDSVVCFKDEAAAVRCGTALQSRGSSETSPPAPKPLLLEDLIETLGDSPDMEVCLVDEVIETIIDDDTEGAEGDEDGVNGLTAELMAGPRVVASDETDEVLGSVMGESAQESSMSPAAVRTMLNRLLEDDDVDVVWDDESDFLPPRDDDDDGCGTE